MEAKYNEKRMFWANLTYFIALTLFTVLRLINALGLLDSLPSLWSNYIFTIITQVLILFIIPMTIYLFIFKQKPKQVFDNFMFHKVSSKTIFYSFLIGICVYFIISYVSSFFNMWLQFFGYEGFTQYATDEKTYSSFYEFLLGLLFVAVLPGVFEEFSNRGILLSGLTKGSTLRAVLLSGLLFGLMHLNINQFFYATASGIIMATVAVITKSIYPSMIIHFTNNALNVYFTYSVENETFGQNIYNLINLVNVSAMGRFVIYITFGTFIVIALLWLLTKLFSERKIRQYNKFISEVKHNSKEIDMQNYEELSYLYKLAKKEGIDIKNIIPNFKNKNSENKQNIEHKINVLSVLKIMYNSTFNNKQKYKPTFKENLFLYASIFLGAVTTLFTFIWGLL